MNIIQVAGFLGRDPETRFTSDAVKVTTLSVACTVQKRGVGETTWYKATLWGDRFDKILPHLKKGSAVIVVGDLKKPEIYTDKAGTQHIQLEINTEFVRFSPFGKTEPKEKRSPSVFSNDDEELPF